MKKGFDLQLTNEQVAFIEERELNLAQVMTERLKESISNEIVKDLDINIQTNENGAYTRGEFWLLKRNQIQKIVELLGEGNYSKFLNIISR